MRKPRTARRRRIGFANGYARTGALVQPAGGGSVIDILPHDPDVGA